MKPGPAFIIALFSSFISFLRYFYLYFPIPKKLKLKLKKTAFRFLGNHSTLEIKRNFLSKKYILGTGLEIGALHFPLRLPSQAQVKYIDLFTKIKNENLYPDLKDEIIVETDITEDGETLETIPEETQDFIIANHFLEHCFNPIGAIRVHLSKLRNGGILFYALPNKIFTFDVDRPLTTFQHLVEEDSVGPEAAKSDHYEEWVHFVEKISDKKEIIKRAEELRKSKVRIHFHCWNSETLKDFFRRTKSYLDVKFQIEIFVDNFSEILVILKKE